MCRTVEKSGGAIWSSGSGTLKEFELYDLKAKCARHEREMTTLRQHHDFYIDKAREWKGRALKLEKVLRVHGVAVPERETPEALAAAAASAAKEVGVGVVTKPTLKLFRRK
jgi:hypothetical protein